MQIEAYVMANRTQEIPVPVPGEEITTGITWTYTTPAIYYTIRNQSPYNYQPVGTYTVSVNSYDSYSYNETEPPMVEGCVPCKKGWHKNFYADYAPGESYRYTSSDIRITEIKGSVTANGLTPGRYVIVIDYWVGSRSVGDFQEPDYKLDYSGYQSHMTVKQGTHGIVSGEIIGLEKWTGTRGYGIGTLGGIHVRQKCNVTVAEGETSKVITYGDNSFSLSALAGLHNFGVEYSDIVVGSFYSAAAGINPKIYTDGSET